MLDLGRHPDIPRDRWRLEVLGLCSNPLELDWQAFTAFEEVTRTNDFHCVTGWSRLGMRWTGVRMADLLERARPKEAARFLLVLGYDDYTTNLRLPADALLAHSVDGESLSREHGGPARLVVPSLYGWKGAKWVRRLLLLEEEELGYWERAGYSNTADPWTQDRYTPGFWSG